MKYFYFACFIVAAAFVLRAQTNLLTSGTVTNAATRAANRPAPTEMRPTEIHSDSGQFFLKSNVFVYRGNVFVDNPQMKLTCQLMTVVAPAMPEGKYNRATALTNVVIDWVDEQGTNHAVSDKAVYTYVLTNSAVSPAEHWETNATVVLSGEPIVVNSSGTLQGDPIIWDRINDTITSPHMTRTTINQSGTNKTSVFGPPTKTNPVPK